MASEAGNPNMFKADQEFAFQAYLSARPDYTLSNFYDILWDYHKANGGQWTLAHDVGCGPGQVAELLCSRFGKVIASDATPFHINFAKQRLGEKDVEFVIAKAEELSNAEAADMICAAEVMPLVDQPRAVQNFAKLLKPGGTLAMWFYGGPIFPDDKQEIQTLFRKIDAKSFDVLKPFKGTSWENIWNVIASWFDQIGLPESDWKDVRRLKWNSGVVPLTFLDFEDLEYDVVCRSEVGKDDKVEEIKDKSFWSKKVDFDWAKAFIDAQIPRPGDYVTDEIKDMYAKLKELMGSEQHDIAWPVVLVLATRK